MQQDFRLTQIMTSACPAELTKTDLKRYEILGVKKWCEGPSQEFISYECRPSVRSGRSNIERCVTKVLLMGKELEKLLLGLTVSK